MAKNVSFEQFRERAAGPQRAIIEQGYEQVKRFRWGVVLGVGGTGLIPKQTRRRESQPRRPIHFHSDAPAEN